MCGFRGADKFRGDRIDGARTVSRAAKYNPASRPLVLPTNHPLPGEDSSSVLLHDAEPRCPTALALEVVEQLREGSKLSSARTA